MKVSNRYLIFSNCFKVCLTTLLFIFALWYVVIRVSPVRLDAMTKYIFPLTVSPCYFVYDHTRFFLDYRIQFFDEIDGKEKLVKETVISNKNWNKVIGGSNDRKDIMAHSAGWANRISSIAAQRLLSYYNCKHHIVQLDSDITADQKFKTVKIVSTSSDDRSFRNELTVKCGEDERR